MKLFFKELEEEQKDKFLWTRHGLKVVILTTAATTTDKQSSNCEFSFFFFFFNLHFHFSRIPNSLNIFCQIARLTCLIFYIWRSVSRKAWRKCDSQLASLAPVPSQISSIYSLFFAIAKHTFQFSILHTLKAKFFSSGLSLSSLIEKKDVASPPQV
jgi:hypothetical protein